MQSIYILDLNFLGHSNTIAAFLINTSIGPILIETGPHSAFDQLKEALNAHGLKPNEIKHVLVTHIHLDHAGAAWAFAEMGAKIYMHPFGAAHMIDPSKLIASATKIYGDKMDFLWGALKPIDKAAIMTPEDGSTLTFGDVEIKCLYTPGHAYHHIAWQIGDSIITGDVAGVRIAEGPAVPPCPPPDIDIEAWISSIDLLIKHNPRYLYLTHFGKISDPEKHLKELKIRLIKYADFIKVEALDGKTPEEIIPIFRQMALDDLREHGVHGEDLERYDAANPADMSVAGLLRYWVKKSRSQA